MTIAQDEARELLAKLRAKPENKVRVHGVTKLLFTEITSLVLTAMQEIPLGLPLRLECLSVWIVQGFIENWGHMSPL